MIGIENNQTLACTYANVTDCERAGVHNIIAWSPTTGEKSIISSHAFNRLSISRMVQNNDPVLGSDGEPLFLALSDPKVRIVSVDERLAEMRGWLTSQDE